MKKICVFMILIVSGGMVSIAQDATQTTKDNSPSFSKSLGLFVFPNNNQDKATQSSDEDYCYNWAREETNYDPINPTKVEVQQVETGPDGSAVVGGAKGAAAGAAIGAIAGDAGKGAAIGAVVGGLGGRRARVAQDQQAQQKNVQSAAAEEANMAEDFKKAFTACMQAKGYTVQ